MAKRRDSKLNVQALARRVPELMACIGPKAEFVNVSIDLGAGEPTCTTHFSNDANYRYANFDGVGKPPYYSNNVLMIDDIYLQCASVSPMGAADMKAAFDANWPAGSFVDQWLADPDIIKNKLKKLRNFHKMLALGIGYGMGAKKMVNASYDAGYVLAFTDAKKFGNSYWQLYAGVKRFSDKLAREVENKGFIVNPFGYRGVPEPRKAFNFFIQSSVSGIMHAFLAILGARCPYMVLLTVIHDELLVEVPKEMVEQFRKDKEEVTAELNRQLNWSVDIRTGFVVGSNWYEAK